MEQILNQAMVEMYVEQMSTQTNRSIDAICTEFFRAEAVTQSENQQVYDHLKDRIGLSLKELEIFFTCGERQKREATGIDCL